MKSKTMTAKNGSNTVNLQPKKRRGLGKPFTKDDPRINRKGYLKPRVQRELEALIDEVFDEEIDVMLRGKKEKITQLKAGLIDLWRNKNIFGRMNLLDRRFGKVTERVDLTSGNEKLELKIEDERFNRAIASLADAIRESVSGTGGKQDGKVDPAK